MQKTPMFYFLQRMEWFYKTAQSENWLEATRHPAMPIKNRDYRSIYLDYDYDYEKREEKKEYYIARWSFSRLSGIDSTLPKNVLDDMDSDICIDANSKIIKFLGSNWALLFHENDRPSEFIFITNMKFPELQDRGGIEWDEKGNEIYNPYRVIGQSFWEDVYCGEDYLENLKQTNTEIPPISTEPPDGYHLCLPKMSMDHDISKTIKQIVKYDKDIRSGKLQPLLEVPGFENFRISDRYLKFYFHKETLAQFRVYCLRTGGCFACCLNYDEKNRLLSYIIGEMKEIRPDKSKPALTQLILDGDGIEVKFHLTGYPASYKTIVKNCLLGQQIEWNENGEVISHINLDTPKPWSDIPKKTDNINVNVTEKQIDFSRLLSDYNLYTQKFIQSVLDHSQINVKLLNDWYYVSDREDTIPIFCCFKFEEMQICILSEYEYRIIWVQYDSDKKLNNKIKSLKNELSRIINRVTIDKNTFKSHPNNVFSVSCLTTDEFLPKYVIWNKKNYVFVTQKLVARTIEQYYTGQVGILTMKKDEGRNNKLAQWLDFIPEETRKTFSSDQQNICIMPTEKAGTIYKVVPEKIMEIFPHELEKFKKTSKK
ncbi:MAG: hypothetical protein LBC20_18270 [Planctomycetaceae bacterium]|jgi:hypothetical protein|nr:hypothetical protein [Planctomycetaceae bacterium]